MAPTLNNGDYGLSLPQWRPIKRFDIVVFKFRGEYLIKRVIGLPNEEITLEEGKLFVFGVKVEQPLIDNATSYSIKVNKDSYFVLGDNRPDSFDSRYFGEVDKDKIIGVGFIKLGRI